MTHPSAPNGAWPSSGDAGGWSASTEHGRWPARGAGEDGWGPATSVHSESARRVGRPAGREPAMPARPQRPQRPQRRTGGWAPAGPVSAREQRATRAADRRTEQAVRDLRTPQVRERGVSWWAALLVLIVIAVIGGVIDTIGSGVSGGFNIGIVVASIVAVLIVRRSHLFPVVIAPPIVYSLGALFQLYIRSSGLNDKKVVFDAAANYLVYGFPAIAAATAAVLIIAGIRLITRK